MQEKVEEVSISLYTMYASDNPEAMITFVRLRLENYNEWSSTLFKPNAKWDLLMVR